MPEVLNNVQIVPLLGSQLVGRPRRHGHGMTFIVPVICVSDTESSFPEFSMQKLHSRLKALVPMTTYGMSIRQRLGPFKKG
ncbi:MAG: hypothetical protein HEP71_18515 [Roseivirga sp.]|nr:hypothetical protein [Roseivirga sp.]